MKKIYSIVLLSMAMLSVGELNAQDFIYRMDATTNGVVVSMAGASVTVRDDDTQGQGAPDAGYPMRGVDYTLTIVGGCPGGSRMAFHVDELSINASDTLYVYDGPDTTGRLVAKFNYYFGGVHEGDYIFETPLNTTGMLTVRFRTGSTFQSNSDGVGNGFVLTFFCGVPCETVVPVIDSVFYRTRNGVIYDSAYTREVTQYDTIWRDPDDHDAGYTGIDTINFIGAHLCIGDGVIFKGHGDYTFNYGYYTPSDATSEFIWDMDNEGDTLRGTGLTMPSYEEYQRTGCFNLTLDIIDAYGCTNSVFTSVRVRTAMNPIKTIFTLSDICNRDSLMVNMGYDGENATLTLRKVLSDSAVSKTYEVRTFIPDGCDCVTPSYFEAPVEFTEFPNNRRVQSAKDICSICINMEHSFQGDIYITIVCPTGQEAVIKWGHNSSCNPTGIPATAPSVVSVPTGTQGGSQYVPVNGGTSYGSGDNLGFPLDGAYTSAPNDNSSHKCDSMYNPFGKGLDYCFSRDTNYTLITGQNAKAVWSWSDPCPNGNFYIVSSGNTLNLPVTFDPVPSWFNSSVAGQTPTANGGQINTKHPSDHENKTDYYLPWTTFNELVGCPLNGLWKIRVYDTWGSDNGWIFNWTMDMCNVKQANDCDYTVGLDSLVWRPDPDTSYNDYDLGHYRGLTVRQHTPTVSYISSRDTAGTFPIDVLVYDEFGCVWDTNTRITTYWTPEPNLGADTTLCGVDRTMLDARDRHAATENYSYTWVPTGEDTPTIMTQEEATSDITYVVRVTNTRRQTICQTRDTIHVGLRKQPLPNFSPIPFTFEGCAPMTLTFDNQTVDATHYLWDFGDGITSELPSPTHTYSEGTYTLKYYAYSDEGCVDSIVSNAGIAVFPSPKAAFSWSPVYPSVLSPVVNFNNETTPQTYNMRYFWEVQYDRNNPLSVETLTDVNPIYDFSQYASGSDVSGNYAVRLIARSDNRAPSGNMIQCLDTAANNILVINDFLQFPNVITPNGDGINDRFVIQNLVDGLGYPVNTLDIYNKWGVHVYHKENISSDADFWDPSDMPAGTYFYRFSARGYNGNIEHNGAIEVIK